MKSPGKKFVATVAMYLFATLFIAAPAFSAAHVGTDKGPGAALSKNHPAFRSMVQLQARQPNSSQSLNTGRGQVDEARQQARGANFKRKPTAAEKRQQVEEARQQARGPDFNRKPTAVEKRQQVEKVRQQARGPDFNRKPTAAEKQQQVERVRQQARGPDVNRKPTDMEKGKRMNEAGAKR